MPPLRQTIQVEASLPGERLDTHLRSLFPMISRGTFQRMMREGNLTVNGLPAKPTHHPRAGEEILLVWPEAKTAEARPQEMPLSILFEDDDLLVVNKAPGVVVHPAAGNLEGTLVNGLLHYCAGRLSGIGGVARPGIVHRLDRDTSGCLVVAKNDETHVALSRQFADRLTGKIYLAILHGFVRPERGEIRAAIARHPAHRKRMAVAEGEGRAAHTAFRVTRRLRAATLVEAVLHTGRTHQVRVHFQHLGFPLVGDDLYAKRQNLRLAETTGYTAPRQMLHAWKLSFDHPRAGRRMEFEAPIPGDFVQALRVLGTAPPSLEPSAAAGSRPRTARTGAGKEPVSLEASTAVCPLCGGANDCAVAPGGAGAAECWCLRVSIPRAILDRVPPALRDQSCLCPRCAKGQ